MTGGTPEHLEDDSSSFPEQDDAFDSWGAANIGVDPLLASFTSEPYTAAKPHIPFYRFLHYPDLLDLKNSGYELERFIPLFDLLDDARYQQALRVRDMLHYAGGGANFNPHRAREFEFEIRAALHRVGKSDVPILLRRVLGRAFPDDTISSLSIDLINVFFWAALAEATKDLLWRYPGLARRAEYLAYPVRSIF